MISRLVVWQNERLLTRYPGSVEPPPGEIVREEVAEVDLLAGGRVLVGRREEDDGDDDEAEDGEDDEGGDEHALPVAVAAGGRHQLLEKKSKNILLGGIGPVRVFLGAGYVFFFGILLK